MRSGGGTEVWRTKCVARWNRRPAFQQWVITSVRPRRDEQSTRWLFKVPFFSCYNSLQQQQQQRKLIVTSPAVVGEVTGACRNNCSRCRWTCIYCCFRCSESVHDKHHRHRLISHHVRFIMFILCRLGLFDSFSHVVCLPRRVSVGRRTWLQETRRLRQ